MKLYYVLAKWPARQSSSFDFNLIWAVAAARSVEAAVDIVFSDVSYDRRQKAEVYTQEKEFPNFCCSIDWSDTNTSGVRFLLGWGRLTKEEFEARRAVLQGAVVQKRYLE